MGKPVPGSREAANESAKAAQDAVCALLAALVELRIIPAEHVDETVERVIASLPPVRQQSAREEVRYGLDV